MLVADNSALIRDGDGDFSLVVEYDALTTQAAFESRIDRAIDKILFLVGDFLQEFIAAFHIQMTGGAGAYTAAVVVEVNVELLGQFENRQVLEITADGFGRDRSIFK